MKKEDLSIFVQVTEDEDFSKISFVYREIAEVEKRYKARCLQYHTLY